MNTIIDIPALHEYFWRKSTDGIVTISQDGLARVLDVNYNRLHEKITQACGQGRITKLSWSTKGTVFQVTDPDTFIPKSKKRLDKNVVHQWLWDNSNAGQLIISKATITEKFNLNVEYIRQEFLPRLELENRIVRKGFNNQGIILEITDPSTWKLPIEAKRKPPDFRFKPKRWSCKDCKKIFYHYKPGSVPFRCYECKQRWQVLRSRKYYERDLTCSHCHQRVHERPGHRRIFICQRCREILGNTALQSPTKRPDKAREAPGDVEEVVLDGWGW